MKNLPGFPKTMNHPSYAPARIGRGDRDGFPARFPPVEVFSPDQEEQYRARGYAVPGEAPVATAAGYREYPKMLHHPEHEAAVPDETVAERKDGQLVTTLIRGKPEKHPAVVVNTPAEESAWRAKGWGDLAKPDPAAFATAKASPYVAGRQHAEYPKWINGVLVHDPDGPSSGPAQYPKWVHGVIMQTEAEHRERFPLDFAAIPPASGVADPLSSALAEIERLKQQLAEASRKRPPGRPRKSSIAA